MILADSPVIEIAAGTVNDSTAQEVYRNLQVLYGTHTGEQALPLTTAPSLRRRRSWNALASTSTCHGLKCISATRIPLGSEAPTRIPTA